MRWIVGDVQGCAREFDRLLREIRFDDARDELWSAGDLINRGPDSLLALRLWHDAGGQAVIGNHETYALLAHARRRSRKADTLDALFAAPDADRWFARLRALPVLAHLPGRGDGPDVWLVHAGLDPRWTDLAAVAARLNAEPHDDVWLESDEINCATRIRCCLETGERTRHAGPAEDCPPPFRPWDDFYRGDALVVHGHWALRGYYRRRRTLGLDSGCVYGGPLTAWCQEEDRVVQVPSTSP